MRVLGFDPGAHAGWCLLDCGGKRPHYVASGVLEVGHQTEGKTRTPSVVRQVRRVADDHLVTFTRETMRVLYDHGPDLIAVERIQEVHPTGKHAARTGQATGTSIATGLVLASGIAWSICALGIANRIRVVTAREEDWRKALGCKPPRGQSADAWIGRVIPARIDGWPPPLTSGVTAHVRDAAGVAEYAAGLGRTGA